MAFTYDYNATALRLAHALKQVPPEAFARAVRLIETTIRELGNTAWDAGYRGHAADVEEVRQKTKPRRKGVGV